MLSCDLRDCFLQFFKKNHHHVFTSASLVPHNDPSLLFTTAGMVPLKDMFMGRETPPCSRLTSSQKCVRAGGKHNDLEQVGHTLRHHTFFEMLGNFSIGDYFKEKAILYAWTFLTQELGLNPEKLWVTVYHTDEEAITLWQKIAGLSSDRIIRMATDDNFWSAGDTGPCGPCSEIFYDHGPAFFGGLPGTPQADGDRFMEIWNLVFMQYNQVDGKRIPLPAQSIDTGMGLERLAAVIQGVGDNFETDIFRALINASKALVGGGNEHRVAHRVIADHVRAISFLIADGVLPEAEGRGYVLRRILRRALRYVHYLGGTNTHLSHLVPVLIEKMGKTYPELGQNEALITLTLTHEAERFHDLLTYGLELLSRWMEQAQKGQKLDGQRAFQLYDTYGFPLDLTCDVLREKGYGVDEDGFYQAMEIQKEASRKSWPTMMSGHKTLDFSPLPSTTFVGYDQTHCATTIVKLLDCQGHERQRLETGQEAWIVTEKTCFYGESGGQVGDRGEIVGDHAGIFRVKDATWQGKWLIHHGLVEKGSLDLGEIVTLTIDEQQRKAAARHHSATHLLQAALRIVLGNHVAQKGSLVKPDGLRFDFSHPKVLTEQEIKNVEDWINQAIWSNVAVATHLMEHRKAMAFGALALFGEKYDSEVRVVEMPGWSKELCGGTHVARTGEIGLFKILSQSAVASGVRRLEAVVGKAALDHVQHIEAKLREISGILKVTSDMAATKVRDLLARPGIKSLGHLDWNKEDQTTPVLWWAVGDDRPLAALRTELDWAKDASRGMILVVMEKQGGVNLHLALGQNCSWDATALLKDFMGSEGRGGGSASMAQGSSSKWTKAEEVAACFKNFFGQKISRN